MRKVAIQDANILIDLLRTGLFEISLGLDYQFTTTSLIYDELHLEQQQVINTWIHAGRFAVLPTSEQELSAIQEMITEDSRLSPQDWSAIYFALKEKAILLTGDKHLRAMAKKKSVSYFGILWIFDQLVETGLLEPEEALIFLENLCAINKRLPISEISERRKSWSV